MAVEWAMRSILAGLLLVCLAQARADAGPPLVGEREVIVGTATNTQIVVRYGDCRMSSTYLADTQVRPVGGEPVPTTAEYGPAAMAHVAFILPPTEVLQPGTKYEVLSRVVTPCSGSVDEDCLADEPAVIATFRTADGPDRTPPAPIGAATVERGTPRHCDDPSCGEPPGYWIFPLLYSWEPGHDDESPLYYQIVRHADDGSTSMEVVYVSTANVAGFRTCPPAWTGNQFMWESFWAYNDDYSVRAVDLSGNAVEGPSVHVTFDCATAFAVDDRPAYPEAGPSGGGGGCSAAGHSAGPAPPLLLLALLLTARRAAAGRRAGRPACPSARPN